MECTFVSDGVCCLLSDKIKETFGKDVGDEFNRENVKYSFLFARECQKRHALMRELDREPDFFEEVKPYADKYHTLLDEWTEEVL